MLLSATQQDVSAFLEHLRNHGIDSRSSARKLSCLRGFYKWLLLDRRIHHDPTINIESPKSWKVLPKSLAEPEVNEMLERAALAASHPQARATALVALGCPIPFATSLYDRVAPNGIDCRYVQTRRWKAVA